LGETIVFTFTGTKIPALAMFRSVDQ